MFHQNSASSCDAKPGKRVGHREAFQSKVASHFSVVARFPPVVEYVRQTMVRSATAGVRLTMQPLDEIDARLVFRRRFVH